VRLPGTEFRRERGAQLREVGFAAGLIILLGIALVTLLALIVDVLVEGAGSLSPAFFTDGPSRIDPSSSGISIAITPRSKSLSMSWRGMCACSSISRTCGRISWSANSYTLSRKSTSSS